MTQLAASDVIAGMEPVKTSMQAQWLAVTPKVAAFLLNGANKDNRAIREERVRRIVDDIQADRWKPNGQPIIISETGKLLDGQHRLSAIQKTNKTQPCLVITGAPEDIYATLDSGAARTKGDVFSHHGEKYTNLLSAVVCKIWQWKHGHGVMKAYPSTQEALEFIAKHPRIRTIIKAMPGPRDCVMRHSVLGMLVFLFEEKDRELADEFFRAIVDGRTRYKPFHRCREMLIKYSRTMGRLDATVQIALCVKAWNAVRQKKSDAHITWDRNRESMPKIV